MICADANLAINYCIIRCDENVEALNVVLIKNQYVNVSVIAQRISYTTTYGERWESVPSVFTLLNDDLFWNEFNQVGNTFLFKASGPNFQIFRVHETNLNECKRFDDLNWAHFSRSEIFVVAINAVAFEIVTDSSAPWTPCVSLGLFAVAWVMLIFSSAIETFHFVCLRPSGHFLHRIYIVRKYENTICCTVAFENRTKFNNL